MTAAQSVTSADTVTQTLLETGWVSPPQIQRLCIIAAAKLGHDYNLGNQTDRSNCKLDPTRRCVWLSKRLTTWRSRQMASCHVLRQFTCGVPRRK